MPTKIDFILLILIGIFGSVANLLLTQSYKLAEVSLTTPLKYLALLYAIIFGFFIAITLCVVYLFTIDIVSRKK